MNNFFDAGGASVLVKCIDDRIARVPMTNLDAALLYEIMACIKTIMNNAVGMEGMIEHSNAIERIAETLRFEWKPLALQVLEILSVSCYYSDRSTKLVISGMKRLAKSRQEPVYYVLSKALIEQDIEVKAGVMQFINNIIMGLDDLRNRLHVRSEFSARLLQENFNTAVEQVDTDVAFINEVGVTISSPEHAKRRLELVSLYGPKALTSLSAFLEQNTTDNDIAAKVITIGNGKNIIQYTPSQGQMASCLIAAKNKENNMQDKMIEIFGGKRTKRRWYELDGEDFKWCSGHDRENDFKGVIPMSSVIDIRYYTTDPNLLQASEYCFEFETDDRTFALGCESADEKDCWILALQYARDSAIMKKSSYRLVSEELHPSDVMQHYSMFKKQGTLYSSLAVEDRQHIITADGVDTNDFRSVSNFLYHELLADGYESKLLELMQELLLLPPNSQNELTALLRYARELRCSHYDEAMISGTPVSILEEKRQKGGSAYSQVSKLALIVMNKEAEIAQLQDKLRNYQTQYGSAKLSSLYIPKLLPDDNDTDATGLPSVFKDTDSELPPPPPPPPPPRSVTSNGDNNPEGEVPRDQKYEKYSKMFKAGLPEGAIRSKMTLDGFSSSDIESYLAHRANNNLQKGSSIGAAVGISNDSKDISKDEKYEKYTKMMKILPRGAVENKMRMDGLSQAEIDSFFGIDGSSSSAPAAKKDVEDPPLGMSARQPVTPTCKMKGLYWNKIPSKDVKDGTVWFYGAEQDYVMPAEVKTALEEEFSAASVVKKEETIEKPGKPKLVSLYDGKRTQNVLIAIGKLRMTPKEITDLVFKLDPDNLTFELTQTILAICPTIEEVNTALSYQNPQDMDMVGQLFINLAEIPRISQRLDCHKMAFTWGDDYSSISSKLGTLHSACREIGDNLAVQKILRMVLTIGNYLNGGTSRGCAYGVKLDTLLKLSTLKGNGKESSDTLLSFLVSTIEVYYPELLSLTGEWVSIWAAADVSLSQVDQDIKQLEGQISRAKFEYTQGIAMITEKHGEIIGVPLQLRLADYLSFAEPKLNELKQKLAMVDQLCKQTMARFCEHYKAEEDATKQFFGLLCSFGKAFQSAVDELSKKKQETERAKKRATDLDKRKLGNIYSLTHSLTHSLTYSLTHSELMQKRASQMNDVDVPVFTENIFSEFHAREKANPADLMAEFKKKMQARATANELKISTDDLQSNEVIKHKTHRRPLPPIPGSAGLKPPPPPPPTLNL